MGLFRKKKKNAVIVKTITQVLNESIKEHSTLVEELERMKPRLSKFVAGYRGYLSTYRYVHSTGITLSLKKGITDYPDGFFALADKLGLNIEPNCGSTYSSFDRQKSFVVRAKSK